MDKQKRFSICILRHAYFPDDPNTRRQAFALMEAGFAVEIICLRKQRQIPKENINGIIVLRIPFSHKRLGMIRYFIEYSLSFIMMSFVLIIQFIKRRYDFIQVSTMPDFLVFSTLIPKFLGAKVLLDIHEPTPELWITKYGPNRLRLLLLLQKKIEQLSILYAHRCFTVTESLRNRLGQRGADISKISVIPNVCEQIFEETFSNYLKRKPINPSMKFTLITHGLIEERYGHDIAIRAISCLKNKIYNLEYKIAGEGKYIQNLYELVDELGCNSIVSFLGFLPFKDLLREIIESDLAIIPMKRSPYSELIETNKMYEYMALQKPIIISRLKAVEENFDDSCVQFFEPDNYEDLARCILELYNKPEKRRILIENSCRLYEKIRWAETKKIYLKMIQDLAAN